MTSWTRSKFSLTCAASRPPARASAQCLLSVTAKQTATSAGAASCFFAALLSFTPAVVSQPANDNFANRAVIAGGNAAVFGNLANATFEAGEPFLPEISSGQTAWWTWTAPSNGIVTLAVNATNFSPLLTVYTGDDLASLSLVASNNYRVCYSDGSCGCHWRERSRITFHVAHGRQYQIAADSAIITDAIMAPLYIAGPGGVQVLGGWAPTFTTNVPAGGGLELDLQLTPAPANDDFEHPTCLSGARTSIAASNAGATKQPGEPDHLGNPGGSSVWYSWTAPASGRVTLSTNNVPPYLPPSWSGGDYGVVTIEIFPGPPSCGDQIDQDPPPQFYPLFAAYTGTAVDSLTAANCLPMALAAYPNAVEFDAIQGQTCRIAFDGNMGTTGDLTLYLALTKPASNDNFKNRIKLHGINVAATGFNAGATHEPGEPVLPGAVGKSVWWSWTAPLSGTVSIDLSGSDYSFPVGVFSGTSVTGLSLIAANPGGLSFDAVQGQTYQIAIEDASGLTGAITFTVQAPQVQLPLARTPRRSGLGTLLSYVASPHQVVLLQYSTDGTHWGNVRTATAHQGKVEFYVRPSLTSPHFQFRAIVVDYQ